MDEEILADYDVRSPASRTLLTVIGTVVVVVLLGALVLGTSILLRKTKVATSVIELGSSVQVKVDAGSADVRIVEGESDVIKVSARITSGIRKTDFALGRRGDEIKIVSGCQTWLSPGCGVTTTISVPKGLPVVVATSSGDVRADAVTQGVLTVTSGSGDVSVTDLDVDEFSAQTRSGDIRAVFAKQPFALKAITDDGDIDATIPAGKRTYVVMAKSKSGDVSSSLKSDTDGQGFIRATTGSGDVKLGTS